jgi:hypothetical protein
MNLCIFIAFLYVFINLLSTHSLFAKEVFILSQASLFSTSFQEPSWGPLGDILETSWSPLGAFLETFWRPLGALLKAS